MSKVNYTLHTDAVRDYIVPSLPSLEEIKFAYTSEADLINLCVLHYTAKAWREVNPEESMNAKLIKRGLSRRKRFELLSEVAAAGAAQGAEEGPGAKGIARAAGPGDEQLQQ